jgi:hypothetical protein
MTKPIIGILLFSSAHDKIHAVKALRRSKRSNPTEMSGNGTHKLQKQTKSNSVDNHVYYVKNHVLKKM